jgi:hypothetical protein
MIAKTKPIPKQKYLLKKNLNEATELLYKYCKSIDDWSTRWKISEIDLTIGQAITCQFKLFLIKCIEKGRAKRTIKMYASYLWVLGGELIRQINEDDSERNLLAKDLIFKHIDDTGGPYWRHARDETEHAQYDSVCKQFFKFMVDNSE